MIHSLKIKNFLSFKDEVTYSFEATKDKHLEEYQVVEVAPGVRLTKLGVVYGANASGKSNLINAFEFLHDFWFHTPENKDEKIDVTPFLLDDNTPQEPAEFTLTFYLEGKKHIYKLIVKESAVISETLHYYPGTQPMELFSRQFVENVSDIVFNPKLKIGALAKEEISIKCLTNMSFLAAYNKVNVHIVELDNVSTWMKKQYMSSIEPDVRLTNFVQDIIIKDNEVKKYILKFLHEADFNISNINTKIETNPVPDDFFEMIMHSNVPADEKERLKKERTFSVPHTTFTHKVMNSKGTDVSYDLPEHLQSDGTLRTMGISGVLNLVIKRNAFLAVDEIEASLHPKLIEFIIENFLKQSKTAQLLVSTHYDGLLEEEDLLRTDNIWFTSKKKDGSTELYSLSDFTGLSRISSLQKAYKYGKFGAIPNI